MYFGSLQSFTEALLSGDRRISAIRRAIQRSKKLLSDALAEDFPDRLFYPVEDASGDVEDIQVTNMEFQSIQIIAIGEQHCTVAFEAHVEFSAYVSYDDPDTAVVDSSENFYMALYKKAGTINETTTVSGTMKLGVGRKWDSVSSVDAISIDQEDIRVTAAPDELERI